MLVSLRAAGACMQISQHLYRVDDRVLQRCSKRAIFGSISLLEKTCKLFLRICCTAI